MSWTSGSTWKVEVGIPLETPVNMYKSTSRLNRHKYRCEKLSLARLEQSVVTSRKNRKPIEMKKRKKEYKSPCTETAVLASYCDY